MHEWASHPQKWDKPRGFMHRHVSWLVVQPARPKFGFFPPFLTVKWGGRNKEQQGEEKKYCADQSPPTAKPIFFLSVFLGKGARGPLYFFWELFVRVSLIKFRGKNGSNVYRRLPGAKKYPEISIALKPGWFSLRVIESQRGSFYV